MRNSIYYTLAILTLLIPGMTKAQQTKPNQKSKIIAVEVLFAETAAKKGIPYAFKTFLDSTGYLVNGNNIVNGQQLYKNIPSDTIDLLSWHPQYARVNQKGDFGFTAGPYLYYPKKGGQPIASGYYFSIWEKNNAGDYKIKFDGGVKHNKVMSLVTEQMKLPIPETLQEVIKKKSKASPALSNQQFEQGLAQKQPLLNPRFFATNFLLLRPNEMMYQHIDAKLHQPQFFYLSKIERYDQEKNLFYVCGNLALNEEAAKQNKYCGYYVRIWQNEKSGWKIVADVQQY